MCYNDNQLVELADAGHFFETLEVDVQALRAQLCPASPSGGSSLQAATPVQSSAGYHCMSRYDPPSAPPPPLRRHCYRRPRRRRRRRPRPHLPRRRCAAPRPPPRPPRATRAVGAMPSRHDRRTARRLRPVAASAIQNAPPPIGSGGVVPTQCLVARAWCFICVLVHCKTREKLIYNFSRTRRDRASDETDERRPEQAPSSDACMHVHVSRPGSRRGSGLALGCPPRASGSRRATGARVLALGRPPRAQTHAAGSGLALAGPGPRRGFRPCAPRPRPTPRLRPCASRPATC